MLLRVLLAVPGTALRRDLQKSLAVPDVMIQTTGSNGLKNGMWKRLGALNADCIVVDQTLMPTPVEESIAALRQLPDGPAVVVLSEREDAEGRARLLALGCDAVLNSLLPPEMLSKTLLAILHRRRLSAVENLSRRPVAAQPRLTDFVSHSAAMQAFMSVVLRVAGSDASLLIQGETGVGKERLARAIHAQNARAGGPFIAVNCGALPETLLESELFGHEQGAFTGATRSRRGCFEMAHRGTIFLDEITEMSIHLQVRLLRVLQEYEIQPVGAETPIKISLRVMAATNRDIEEEVRLGRFRRDLYYRLSVVSLTIPPLRARREDIPALAQSYIAFLRPRIGTGDYVLRPEALAALCDYAWPGNVRELINVIERAMLLSNRREITLNDLPDSIRGAAAVALEGPPAGAGIPIETIENLCDRPWREVRDDMLSLLERRYLAQLLAGAQGRIGEAARRAGIRPRSLYEKMKRHGLRKEDYRHPELVKTGAHPRPR